MGKVMPPKGRARVIEGLHGLEVVIPSRKRLLAMVFFPIWLCFWLFAEVAVVGQLVSKPAELASHVALVIWLVAWTVGGGLVLFVVLWTFFGRERVILRPDALVLRHEVMGFARSREYEIGSVSHLRVSPHSFDPWDSRFASRFWGFAGGVIAFDYGSKTFRFGAGIDEAEGRQIVAQLRGRSSLADPPP